MSDDDIPLPPDGRRDGDVHGQVEALWDKLGRQARHIIELENTVRELARLAQEHRDLGRDLAVQVQKLATAGTDPGGSRQHAPGVWAVFEPPGVTDPVTGASDPMVGLVLFVEYYNSVYRGLPGSRAVAIPDCWLSHPALVAEIATLAWSWRAANTGPKANIKDAQYWHHHTRPGFAVRLATEWTHAHCRTNSHKEAGSPARPDRFATTDTAKEPDWPGKSPSTTEEKPATGR